MAGIFGDNADLSNGLLSNRKPVRFSLRLRLPLSASLAGSSCCVEASLAQFPVHSAVSGLGLEALNKPKGTNELRSPAVLRRKAADRIGHQRTRRQMRKELNGLSEQKADERTRYMTREIHPSIHPSMRAYLPTYLHTYIHTDV